MPKKNKGKEHKFSNKLILNQWLISLFGIDPFEEHKIGNRVVRPFHVLIQPIQDPQMEGVDESNIHTFYHNLINAVLFHRAEISRDELLRYEENIVGHTEFINRNRFRPIVWKYYQWLTLLFTEIYLDRYFHDREKLLKNLNRFIGEFNGFYEDYNDVPLYELDDLNKICFQNATGSGKTLLMHVHLLQYRYYAQKKGLERNLSRIILLTPNERLSEQHLKEFSESSIEAHHFVKQRGSLFSGASALARVDVLEITKLADIDGPNTVAVHSLGDENLLLVDEGHRGMSGGKGAKKEEGAWFKRRNMLCEKGFTFEYSATFEQSVMAAGDLEIINNYARCILFDYSYRYFYEDGFGKDYHILNLSHSFDITYENYLTACVLKFYQQMCIYEEKQADLMRFNLEKPLWVFVGSSVSKSAKSKDEKAVLSDVAKVIQFLADFLEKPEQTKTRIENVITGKGTDTGLIDEKNNDIFEGSFQYAAQKMNTLNLTIDQVHEDILKRVFNNPAGGRLSLLRIKGDSGEVELRCGTSEQAFGLINVGDALGLCKHCEEVCTGIEVGESEFTEAQFSTINESSSPVNLLIGSKKFIEGWDCWRVSTMGLMHVGKSEGAQIIQLFGRGVRLKGYEWSLKRSAHTFAFEKRPHYIEELETLNIFGVKADFMERFREFLKEEGLPGNEKKQSITIPLNVTYDFGKKLKIIRPKRKKSDNGREYDFKYDAQVPTVADVPEYFYQNPIISDWYPRIKAIRSRNKMIQGRIKNSGKLYSYHLCMLNYDALFFDLEQFKRERTWYNLNISKKGIQTLLYDPHWYRLYIPEEQLVPDKWDNVVLWQQIASELLKRYCDHYYNYCKRSFLEPRIV